MLASCPQTSKLHFRKPSTPQITAPLWMPTRNWSNLPWGRLIYLKSRRKYKTRIQEQNGEPRNRSTECDTYEQRKRCQEDNQQVEKTHDKLRSNTKQHHLQMSSSARIDFTATIYTLWINTPPRWPLKLHRNKSSVYNQIYTQWASRTVVAVQLKRPAWRSNYSASTNYRKMSHLNFWTLYQKREAIGRTALTHKCMSN